MTRLLERHARSPAHVAPSPVFGRPHIKSRDWLVRAKALAMFENRFVQSWPFRVNILGLVSIDVQLNAVAESYLAS